MLSPSKITKECDKILSVTAPALSERQLLRRLFIICKSLATHQLQAFVSRKKLSYRIAELELKVTELENKLYNHGIY